MFDAARGPQFEGIGEVFAGAEHIVGLVEPPAKSSFHEYLAGGARRRGIACRPPHERLIRPVDRTGQVGGIEILAFKGDRNTLDIEPARAGGTAIGSNRRVEVEQQQNGCQQGQQDPGLGCGFHRLPPSAPTAVRGDTGVRPVRRDGLGSGWITRNCADWIALQAQHASASDKAGYLRRQYELPQQRNAHRTLFPLSIRRREGRILAWKIRRRLGLFPCRSTL